MAPLETSLSQLLTAAQGVVPAPDREVWEHGWAIQDHRRSGRAAWPGQEGPVCLTPDALGAYESAVEELWRDKAIRARWRHEEVWRLVASATVQASQLDDAERQGFLASKLDLMGRAGPAFVAQLISNVAWTTKPICVGDVIIGPADERLFLAADAASSGRLVAESSFRQSWLRERVDPRGQESGQRPVAMCCWSIGQQAAALDDAERRLQEIVDLPLLLERDLPGHKIYRRGDVNRPGVRGLVLDRGAVAHAMQGEALGLELAAFPLVEGEVVRASQVLWYGVEPLPLDELYGQPYLRDAVARCLRDDAIGRRLRVAARWFSKAHYATAHDDAALALGVCLDALLGGKRARSGGPMADRVALLSRDVEQRKARRKAYLEFYAIRSSIAHGAQSGRLDAESLSVGFALSHTIAWQLVDFEATFQPASEEHVEELFDDLRLGVLAWPEAKK
jgi:hypothetical protein